MDVIRKLTGLWQSCPNSDDKCKTLGMASSSLSPCHCSPWK